MFRCRFPECNTFFKVEEKSAQAVKGFSGVTLEEIKTETKSWQIVEEAKRRNSQDRINWKQILGVTLTREVARLKAEGLNPERAYGVIVNAHPELTAEQKRRLLIGVAARFGEMGTAESELNKKKGEA
jgi:hypothetical protein